MTLGGTKCFSRDGWGKAEQFRDKEKLQEIKALGTVLKLTIEPNIWKITLTLQIMWVLGSANNISKDSNMSLEERVSEQKKSCKTIFRVFVFDRGGFKLPEFPNSNSNSSWKSFYLRRKQFALTGQSAQSQALILLEGPNY